MEFIIIREGVVENIIIAASLEDAQKLFPDCMVVERGASLRNIGEVWG
jgi:hypothetical protein